MNRAVPSVQIPVMPANEAQAAANGESSASQIRQPTEINNTLPVNPPSTRHAALVAVTPTIALRLRRAGAGAAPFFATGAGLAGIGGATTGAFTVAAAAVGAVVAGPAFPSRIAFNISCGERRGPAAATTGFASTFAAAASGAGVEVAAAGDPAFARMAAMMSLVEPGFAEGAGGFGAAATDAVASGTEATAGAGLTAEASAAGTNEAAAAAFCARILARMSEVDGFFSSISIRFRMAGEERLNCTDRVRAEPTRPPCVAGILATSFRTDNQTN